MMSSFGQKSWTIINAIPGNGDQWVLILARASARGCIGLFQSISFMQLLSYLSDIPIILRHLWSELFSERGPNLIRRLYLRYILVLLVLYLLSPFDLIPESVFGLLGYVDDLMIVLVVVVYISFLYRNVLTGRT